MEEEQQQRLGQEEMMELLADWRKKLSLQNQKISSIKCEVCEEKNSKYSCPRCDIKQCSLKCYQEHDRDCVKQFFKQVKEGQKGQKISKIDEQKFKKKVMSFRMDEDYLGLQKDCDQITRFQELHDKMENEENVLEQLTDLEKESFERWVQNLNYEKAWVPFWYLEEGKFSVYVQDCSSQEDAATLQKKKFLESIYHDGDSLDEQNYYLVTRYSRLEDFLGKVKDLRLLTKKPPHKTLPYHLMQLIFSSCLVWRFHDGDLLNNREEVFDDILSICDTVHNRAISLDSLAQSVSSVLQKSRIQQYNLQIFAELCFKDLTQILTDKFYIFEILYHLIDTARNIKSLTKIEQQQILHKLNYFASYTKSNLKPAQLKELHLEALIFEYDFKNRAEKISDLTFFQKKKLLL